MALMRAPRRLKAARGARAAAARRGARARCSGVALLYRVAPVLLVAATVEIEASPCTRAPGTAPQMLMASSLRVLAIASCSLAVAAAEPAVDAASRNALQYRANPAAAAAADQAGHFPSAADAASDHHGLGSGTPPRGWNSYDSFTWFVNETQFLRNCKYMADHLLDYGYVCAPPHHHAKWAMMPMSVQQQRTPRMQPHGKLPSATRTWKPGTTPASSTIFGIKHLPRASGCSMTTAAPDLTQNAGPLVGTAQGSVPSLRRSTRWA